LRVRKGDEWIEPGRVDVHAAARQAEKKTRMQGGARA
jgi:hypothetical protein